MRIHAFAAHFPSLFKPYYDTHFAGLLEDGHELTIFATPRLDLEVSEKARRAGLLKRTRYVPGESLRDALRYAHRVAGTVFTAPSDAALAWSVTGVSDWRARLRSFVRASLVSAGSPDVMIVHGHGMLRLVPWLRQLRPSTPLGLYYYGGMPPDVVPPEAEVIEAAIGQVDRVFTCSEYAATEAVALGAAPDKVRVLPLSFDLREFPEGLERGYRVDDFVRLISVGRLARGKGIEHMLQALALLQSDNGGTRIRYTVVGDGPMREHLESNVSSLGLSHLVEFTGAVANDRVLELLSRADALVLPSHSTPTWTETQGTVLQEAMLVGCLVVTTRTGGVPESIPECMTPFQVSEQSPEELAAVLREVEGLSPERMRELGGVVRSWVRTRFDVRQFNRRMLESLDGVRTGRGSW